MDGRMNQLKVAKLSIHPGQPASRGHAPIYWLPFFLLLLRAHKIYCILAIRLLRCSLLSVCVYLTLQSLSLSLYGQAEWLN